MARPTVKPLDACEAADKAALSAYRDLRTRALNLMRGDEERSILSQVIELFWRDATYRVINEARRPTTATNKNAAVSPVLGEFIDQSYVIGVVTAVARLTDQPGEQPHLGVVSIPTLLRLLRDNHALVRREMFVSFDGIPYDPTPPAASMEDFEPGVRWVEIGPHEISNDRHLLFDRLSRKTPDRRARTDVVHRKVLAGLESRLSHPSIIKIRQHRNKVVAHAADAASRTGIDRFGLSLAAVDGANRAIIEVVETLATIFTGEILVGMPVPVAAFDVLEYLGEPFAFPEDLPRLQNVWATTTSEREGWSDGAVVAVLGR